MTTIYLDHNIIDRFDKGETAYLEPVFANKECLPIISLVSVDEIFRGGDQSRSMRNIESLKKLGVKYMHPGLDELHMSIGEVDYNDMHQKWLQMQSDIEPLNNAYFLFISTLFRENEPEAIQDMEQSIIAQIDWIKNNPDRVQILPAQMSEALKQPEEYKRLSKQLIGLNKQLPFTAKEINNILEKCVFWSCVKELKTSTDTTFQLIGNHIANAIENAKTIDDQFTIVLTWLNLFGYWSGKLTRKEKIRSNFSDTSHGTYAIVCDAMLTLDKWFAKRMTAAVAALELRTEVGTDANELLQRIAEKADSR